MRVLLVEDNPTLANSLKDALTHARFAVDCMHDGEAADHVLRTQDYALVILDLGLPKLDGLEVLRRLRQRRWRCPGRSPARRRAVSVQTACLPPVVRVCCSSDADVNCDALSARFHSRP